ncbi:MAG: hypothetical protein N2C14_02335, partial [Planctomycetales bacterium]
IQIDAKRNKPEVLNGGGDGLEIPTGEKGQEELDARKIVFRDVPHGTRVAIEMEAKYQRGRGSVDEYLEQTAIANPHVTLHYVAPDKNERSYKRASEDLPHEAVEIKPHPYGVELGALMYMLKQAKGATLTGFLTDSFTRVTPDVARVLCKTAGLSARAYVSRIGRQEADALYKAIQETKIRAPSTDCISPIGVPQLIQGLHHVIPAEFYVAESRPPAVYRGNPFQIEVALSYGGSPAVRKVPLDDLKDMLSETDARTLRQFLTNSFDGVGPDAAAKILKEAELTARSVPGKLKPKQIGQLHAAMQGVNFSDGQTLNLMRYANRVPLLFQQGACAITQAVIANNWKSYGITQPRGSLPSGPLTLMVHMASVWVPFTSESKEAVAAYPDVLKELRLALQAVGRKLGTYLKRRDKVRHEGERRNTFLRYLREVAQAVGELRASDPEIIYEQLLEVARRETADADMKMDKYGRRVAEMELEDGVFIPKDDVPASSDATDATDATEGAAVMSGEDSQEVDSF